MMIQSNYWRGMLIQKMPKNPAHTLVTGLLLDNLLHRIIPSGWHLNFQEPVTTSTSEPEPDVAVVHVHVLIIEIAMLALRTPALIMEVADATLRRDRGLKKQLYAQKRWCSCVLDYQFNPVAD